MGTGGPGDIAKRKLDVNHKRVDRLYRLEGLGMRSKRPRRHVTSCWRME